MECPQCKSQKTWKDGVRKTTYGDVQRYLCCVCGYRFSDSKVKVGVIEKSLVFPDSVHDFGKLGLVNLLPHKKSFKNLSFAVGEDVGSHSVSIVGKGINGFLRNNKEHRVCVSPERKAKNLVEVEPLREGPAGATGDVKGKIIEYAWWLKKRGRSQVTIEVRANKLNRLLNLCCNSMDPEKVKEVIARQEWKRSTKANVVSIYTDFLKCFGLYWEPPTYKPDYEIPFIPTESEIDQLIAGSGKKMATLLQLLKETAIRIGEACKLRWTDIDVEQRIIRVRAEKNNKPRIFHVSFKLLNMLAMIPKKSERVFPSKSRVFSTYLREMRKRLAQRLSNPRLAEVHFHTLRHWKATQLYHQTKDILFVKEYLGHRRLDSTLAYINIERAIYHEGKPDEFHVKIAQTPKQMKELLEVGFEYVCEKEGLVFFKKRK